MPRSRSRWVRRGESKWTSIVDAWQASGSSARAFCGARGLSLSSFQRWRRRLGTETQAPFVELRPVLPPAPTTAMPPWELEVVLPNGVQLRFRG